MIIALVVAVIFFEKDKNKPKMIGVKKLKSFLIKSYRVFTRLSLTKRYVEQMRKRYELICPEDARSLMCKAMGVTYIIWGASISAVIFIYGLRPTLYTAYLSLITIFVFNRELIEYIVSSMEMKLMNQFDKFLSDTRHRFYRHGMIDEAIEDASEMSEHIMRVNAVKILNVLESSESESVIRLYNETVSNRFLRMFLSVAVYVAEFGDKIVNGISVLLININTLKSDLYIDMMNTKETNYKFSGMIFTVLAPVYLIDGIMKWSIDITPGMAEFYKGTFGVAVRIAIYVLTIVMYIMINELKERNSIGIKEHYLIKGLSHLRFVSRVLNNYEEKFRYKLESTENILYRVGETLTARQFFLKRLIFGVTLFFIYLIISLSVHKENRAVLVQSTQFITKEAGMISDKYIDTASELVLRYVDKYKGSDFERSKVEKELHKEGKIRSEVIFSGVVDEIMQRIAKYKEEYFHWYELIFALFIAGLGYWFPYWMLLYRRKVLYLNMGNEVAQFQSTIMMVMYLNNTTVLKVLELMESFAVIFKEGLKACINDYSAGDLDSLERLKLRERYEPFRRLVDNLIIADKIGIQKAFDEVEEERKVSQEMRNQDYRISRDKKVVYGMVMSFVPAVITVAFYWIIPFAMNALKDLAEYDAIMNSLK
ncbi:MAG: hypothetical protein K0S01_1655 [Herbinix sp.]|jgi:hypothetical protein|nr:hypothetical protein [Herbinix sp.]